jgi:hypothetical protein
MKINNSLYLAIILVPFFAINTFSQSAAHLATFLPDTLGDFIAIKAAVKKEKRENIKDDSVQARVQRGYSSPKGLMAVIAILHGHGVPDYIRGVFLKKGTQVSISKFDAIVWPHGKNDQMTNSITVSVKILDNMMVTIMVLNTTNKKYPLSILQKIDLKSLSTTR